MLHIIPTDVYHTQYCNTIKQEALYMYIIESVLVRIIQTLLRSYGYFPILLE